MKSMRGNVTIDINSYNAILEELNECKTSLNKLIEKTNNVKFFDIHLGYSNKYNLVLTDLGRTVLNEFMEGFPNLKESNPKTRDLIWDFAKEEV